MWSRALIPSCVLIAGLCLSASWAGTPTPFHTLSRKVGEKANDRRFEFLGIRDGKLGVGQSKFATYDESDDNGWSIAGGRIRSKRTGQYLGYDPTGRDNRLVLVDGAGEGTAWVIKSNAAAREEERGTVRAETGPLAGYSIDIVGGAPVLVKTATSDVQAWRIYVHK